MAVTATVAMGLSHQLVLLYVTVSVFTKGVSIYQKQMSVVGGEWLCLHCHHPFT